MSHYLYIEARNFRLFRGTPFFNYRKGMDRAKQHQLFKCVHHIVALASHKLCQGIPSRLSDEQPHMHDHAAAPTSAVFVFFSWKPHVMTTPGDNSAISFGPSVVPARH